MIDWLYGLDLFGTAVFALSGALAAGQHKMDPFGVLVLAAVTAIGGGTIRDCILGATPAFWLLDHNYLYVILLTVVLTLLLVRRPWRLPISTLAIADAVGLALFTVLGAQKAIELEFGGMIAVIMGLVTGVGGGIIRDLLCKKVPMVLRTEVYATASIAGGMLYTISIHYNLMPDIALIAAFSTALIIRLAAIKWHLSLPAFELKQRETK